MKAFIILVLTILQFSYLYAEDIPRLKTLVRFENNGKEIIAILVENGEKLPVRFLNKVIEEKFYRMERGEEAFLEGTIQYQSLKSDTHRNIRPYFMIEIINPVSLYQLGKVEVDQKVSTSYFPDIQTSYSPLLIPVSTEIASAMMMTSTLLLMESLSNRNLEPRGKRDMKKTLIISGGLMATMIFLFDNLKSHIND